MRRTQKTAVAVLVALAAGGIILWNTAAQEGPTTLGVADAKRQAAVWGDRPLDVRGFVQEGSVVYNGSFVERFVIQDEQEQMLVVFNQLPPDAFGAKDVVVRGRLAVLADGTIVLNAEAIHVGCSSKY